MTAAYKRSIWFRRAAARLSSRRLLSPKAVVDKRSHIITLRSLIARHSNSFAISFSAQHESLHVESVVCDLNNATFSREAPLPSWISFLA